MQGAPWSMFAHSYRMTVSSTANQRTTVSLWSTLFFRCLGVVWFKWKNLYNKGRTCLVFWGQVLFPVNSPLFQENSLMKTRDPRKQCRCIWRMHRRKGTTLTHTHTHQESHTISLIITNPHSHSLSLTLSIIITNTHTLTHQHSHLHSLPLTPTDTNTHTHHH